MKDALERIPVPDEEPARERAHKVVLTAFAGREPVRRPSQARRVALGVGVAALAVALAVASPPGMAVVDRVREVVAVERTAPALFSLPAPGRLLVASDAGAVRSTAATLEEIIDEIAITRITERGATRADDRASEAAMEDRKREGYF